MSGELLEGSDGSLNNVTIESMVMLALLEMVELAC